MRTVSYARRKELHAQFEACKLKMERLRELCHRTRGPKKLEVLDRMTDLLNRGLALLARARGERYIPLRLNLAGRYKASKRKSRPA